MQITKESSMSALPSANSTAPQPFPFVRWFLCLLGLLALFYLVFTATEFPVGGFALAIGLGVTAAVLIWQPHAWLIVLPFFCVVVNLAPWSGRFLFNEWDLFVLCCILSPLIRYGFSGQSIVWPRKLVSVYVVLVMLGLSSVSLIDFFTAPHGNPYLSPEFRLYVIKGIIVAWFLSTLLLTELARAPQRATEFLIFGVWFASLAVFVIVLWERETLGLLVSSRDIYQIGNSFLNFATSYRAVGLLADMHTGGESIDGWYLMLIPFNILGIVYFKKISFKLLSFIALNMVFYAVLVGFTRATYAASALSVVSFVALYVYQLKKYGQTPLIMPFSKWMILSYLSLPASTYLAYTVAGFSALLALIFALFSLLGLLYFKRKIGVAYWFLVAFVLMATTYIVVDSLIDSQWVETNTLNLIYAVIGALAIFVAALTAQINMRSTAPHIYTNTAIIMLSAAVFLIFSGSRMQTRMDSVGKDFDTRLSHWNEVMHSSDWSYSDIIIGNGTGSFAYNYLTYDPSLLDKVGSFNLTNTDSSSPLLQFGSGIDLAIGQRVTLLPKQDYRISIEAKAEQDFEISVGFCQRNLLIFDRWGTKCTGSRVKINKSEQMNTYHVGFAADKLEANDRTITLPTLLMLQYKKGSGIVEIGSMTLYDQKDNIVNRNPAFERGLDNWFFYQDFEHLAWHIKNIYLSTFYQTGVLGCLLLLAMLGLLIQKNRLIRPENSAILTATTAVIVAYLAFGFFGDPLDSPRVNSYFYMLLFVAISLNRLTAQPQMNKSSLR
tara:strand:- start:14847 stop:17174 length:2328 start_codon:yes stop_codon:yes gene_type:complete